MSERRRTRLTVAVGGLGAVGLTVARSLDAGIDGLRLVAVAARDRAKAEAKLGHFRNRPSITTPAALAEAAEVVVECLPAAAFAAIARPAIARGRVFVPISVGQLLFHGDLVDEAAKTGARILVPTGALIGLDAVRAAAEGRIDRVRLRTRKPSARLKGAPYLAKAGIALDGLSEPLRVFVGTAREGVAGFPANVNVAAALSLAGIGPDRTELEIWADPTISRNIHEIEVEAEAASFTMRIENQPSAENPATGKITALSVVAALRGLEAPLKVGT